MSNKSRIILARVMIFCSVILIGSGVYLNLQETKPIIDPVSDVTTPDNASVIITTNDGRPPITNDKDESDSNKTDNNDTTTVVPNGSTSSGTTVPNNTTTSGNTFPAAKFTYKVIYPFCRWWHKLLKPIIFPAV